MIFHFYLIKHRICKNKFISWTDLSLFSCRFSHRASNYIDGITYLLQYQNVFAPLIKLEAVRVEC